MPVASKEGSVSANAKEGASAPIASGTPGLIVEHDIMVG
jgi:hypothetical protein